ncbi:MAG: hypothetical protein ACREBS_08560 [Nitrososphaerales archaeon]
MNAVLLILVPLTSVLYVLALTSFAIAAYYGFRLTRLASKMKIMVMITQDGPEFIVGGIVILAVSQISNLLESLLKPLVIDFFNVTSGALLVGSAVMFAIGFQKMYSVYLNERLRSNVYSALEELSESELMKEVEEKPAQWRGKLR